MYTTRIKTSPLKIVKFFTAGVILGMLISCTGEEQKTLSATNEVLEWDLSKTDEISAYTKIQTKTYLSNNYIEVTNGETPSAISTDLIRVWVSKDQAEPYKQLDGSHAFPVGTSIIRVLYTEDGAVSKITATVKAAAGVNPASNDWIFAVTDANGVFTIDDAGEMMVGPLESCNFCHTTRLQTNGLFGL